MYILHIYIYINSILIRPLMKTTFFAISPDVNLASDVEQPAGRWCLAVSLLALRAFSSSRASAC